MAPSRLDAFFAAAVVLAFAGTCVACSRTDANESSQHDAAARASTTSSAPSTPGASTRSSAAAGSHSKHLDPQEFGRSFTLPTVIFEQPSIHGDISGDLNISDAAKVTRQNTGAMNMCYWQLLNGALARGQAVEPCTLVETKFFVQADGSVGDVSVATEDRDFEKCVADAIRRTAFPRPAKEGARVTQMLHLVLPRRLEDR